MTPSQITCSLVLALLLAPAAKADDLEIRISGIDGTEGKVLIILFSDPWSFENPDESTASYHGYYALSPTSGTVGLTLNTIEPGHYALMTFHDRNNNEELDIDFLGVPREPIGFSKNCTPYAMPSFSQCAFQVGPSTPHRQLIQLTSHRLIANGKP